MFENPALIYDSRYFLPDRCAHTLDALEDFVTTSIHAHCEFTSRFRNMQQLYDKRRPNGVDLSSRDEVQCLASN